MNLIQRFLTESDCYKKERMIVPKGVMVHSLGVAQPNVDVFLRMWDKEGQNQCVHAFVTRTSVVQTLPWTHRAWHAGTATKGGPSANNTHISFEICEPSGHTYDGGTMLGYNVEKNAAYFADVYRNAVELTAMLCKTYGLNPIRDVICHSEGFAQGVASNHADVMHWFPKHGKSMNTFRADVKALVDGTVDGTLDGKEEEENMTQRAFDAMFAKAMVTYAAQQGNQTASPWALEAWAKAKTQGVFDGSMPQAPLTREQAALVLDRLKLVK